MSFGASSAPRKWRVLCAKLGIASDSRGQPRTSDRSGGARARLLDRRRAWRRSEMNEVAMLKFIPFVACCIAVQAFAAPLPGTQPLESSEDLASQMVSGIDRFLMDQTSRATESRAPFWHRDVSSPEAYRKSVAKNRADLARMIGLVDARPKFASPELVGTVARPALLASEQAYDIYVVRWPALDGVHGEGLLLEPKKPAVAEVVAI